MADNSELQSATTVVGEKVLKSAVLKVAMTDVKLVGNLEVLLVK